MTYLRKCRDCGVEAATEDALDSFVVCCDSLYGRKLQCKACKVKHSKPRDKEKLRGYKLKYRYGITLEDYANMEEAQDFSCAICNDDISKLFVDHCHNTGRVRGLLCQTCNTGIGMLKDNASMCLKAYEYLKV